MKKVEFSKIVLAKLNLKGKLKADKVWIEEFNKLSEEDKIAIIAGLLKSQDEMIANTIRNEKDIFLPYFGKIRFNKKKKIRYEKEHGTYIEKEPNIINPSTKRLINNITI